MGETKIEDMIKFWKEHPSSFIEEMYGIKLLPYQKVFVDIISKIDKKYIPISMLWRR